MIDEAVGNGSSARSSIVAPRREVLDVDAEHAVEARVDRLHPGAQLGEELGRLGGERPAARAPGDERRASAAASKPARARAQGCFHALSYLRMPVGPITRPRTSRRWAVRTDGVVERDERHVVLEEVLRLPVEREPRARARCPWRARFSSPSIAALR